MSQYDGQAGYESVDFDPFAGDELVDQAPSTEAQREIFAVALMGADASGAYSISLPIHIEGPLDVGALNRAFAGLVMRHDALRASFTQDGLSFVIAGEPTMHFEEHDLGDDVTLEAALVAAERAAAQPFDLVRGPLVRVQLFRMGRESHLLLFTTHHIVCDGWSMAILVGEIPALYAAAVEGRPVDLPAAPSFADYARDRSNELESPEYAVSMRHWLERYSALPPTIELPHSRPRPPIRTYNGGHVDHSFERESVSRLRALGARNGATFLISILASFEAYVARITGEEDLVIGVTAAGQAFHGDPGLVGHCVNLLPLRAGISLDAPFTSVLRAVRNELLGAHEHHHCTFGSVLAQLNPPRDPSRIPLVPILFNLDRQGASGSFGGIRARALHLPRRYEAFELNVNAVESPEGLVFRCSFNADLFEPADIERLFAGFSVFLDGILAEPDRPIAGIPLLPETVRRNLVTERAGPVEPGLASGSFLEWVEERVEMAPERIAVDDDAGHVWSYGELWEYAGRVAAALEGKGLGPGDLIGVRLSRGAPMLGVVLGILRSGAAYLPLDPDFPVDRLSYMVEDGQVSLVLSDTDEPLGGAELLTPEALLASGGASPATAHAPRRLPGSDDLAYVIYTSGSTGKPKGVEIPHSALRNFLGSMRQAPGLAAEDSLLAVTTLSFDISGLELFLPLCVGARVRIASREVAGDGNALLERLEEGEATVMQATPATWRMLLDAGWKGRLKKALCGGESLPEELARSLVERADEVWNLYGPTETTIWSTLERVDGEGPVLVGCPVANTRVYVLDRHDQLVPDGVHGEIWIAGDGVACGYRNRPELTAERFRPDPFVPGGRMYRTGDLGRWRADGRLEHLGRMDFQVKVHGYRIELGEIESALEGFLEVRQAVVMARGEAEDRRLVAYVVFEEDGELLASEIRKRLGSTLPRYMVPGLVWPLESFPLTPNGKVDRKALPDPLATGVKPAISAADLTPAERMISEIFASLLGSEEVNPGDNFFEIGGHSLLALRAADLIAERTGHRPEPRSFFFMTIAEIAASIPGHAQIA